MKFYAIQFANRRGNKTAKLVVDTLNYPHGKTTVSRYSLLYPYSEAMKMEYFYLGPVRETWDEAFNEVLG